MNQHPLHRLPIIALVLLTLLLGGCQGDSDKAEGEAAAGASRPGYLQRPIEDEVFYFLLPDRFANGDPGNDRGAVTGVSHGGFDPNRRGAYHGGDLRGVMQRLDYLQELGVTAIWLTPLLRNQAVQAGGSGYHGYWIVDFTEIDPHWGGDADLHALIDAAHERDMKVFFDIITNHTADVIRYRECHRDDGSYRGQEPGCAYRSVAEVAAGEGYTPFLLEADRETKKPGWLNDPAVYNNQGDSTWKGESIILGDFAGLDDIDTKQAAVLDGFLKIYRDLIDRFRPDGFRIDTVKHVDLAFWQDFSPAIVAHARAQGIPQFTVFGEVYNFDPSELSVYTRHGGLPAVLDFPLQGALRKVLADGSEADVLEAVFAEDDWRNSQGRDARQAMSFTGNHDMGRFGYFLNSGRLATTLSEEEKLVRTALAHSFLFFARGVPVIYYGDEQGFSGDGDDRDAREDMFPSAVASYNDNRLLGSDDSTASDNFNGTHPLYRHIAELSRVYRDSPALRRGVQVPRRHNSDGNTLALSRLLDDDATDTLVLFNFGTEEARVSLPAWSRSYRLYYGYSTEPEVDHGQLTIGLPPLSATVLLGEKRLPRTAPPRIEAQGRIAERLGQRFVVVDYRLEAGDATQQRGALRLHSHWQGREGQDLSSVDTAAPWRAVFPIGADETPTEIPLELTIDNFRGDRATIERRVVVQP